MFRRTLSMILSICLLVTSLPLQAIAETMPEHEHTYSSAVTQEADCVQDGVTTYTCDCGDSFTEPISASGHSYENGVCVLCGDAQTIPGETEPEETIPVTMATEPAEDTAPETESTEETVPETEPREAEEAAEGTVDSAVADDYTYSIITLDDGREAAVITQYSGTETDVVIPDTMDGYPVERIGNAAFRNNNKIQSVVIPEGVTELESGENNSYRGTFAGCTNLKSVTLPESLTKIGNYAFYNCQALPEIELPANVTSIGNNSFGGCTSLSSIDLPVSLTSIGSFAFSSCRNLSSIHLPDSLTSIGSYAFSWCSSLSSIDLPANVTSIGGYAFRNCTSLSSIHLPANLTSLDEHVFYGCSSLSSIYLPDDLTSIGNNAFDGCTSLSSIDLPASLTSINESVFYGCSSLNSIHLPASLTSIGSEAFRGCSGLSSIDLPASLTSIGSYAFWGCTSLSSIALPANLTSISESVFSGCSSLSSVELPASLTSIGRLAFYGCSSLNGVNLPNNLTSIGAAAFRGCSSLSSIDLPANLTSIGSEAFRGCSGLSSIDLPANLTSIESSAFYGCTSLSSIDLPANLTSLGSAAFYECSSLSSIHLPASLTSLGGYAFRDCTSLTSIHLPDTLTSIEYYSFYGCSSLSSIHLPANLTSIGENAFDGCTSLSSIHLPANLTSIGENAFWGCTSLSSVDLPANLTSIGSSAFRGCISLSSIDLPDSLTSIGDYAFTGCTSLSSVDLSDSLTSLGSYAFHGCTNLSSIHLAASLTSIGSYAFSGCTSLSSIDLPDNLTSIGGAAFRGCSSLSSVDFPETLASIGSAAFYECSSLSSIALPDNLTSIGNEAFYRCTSLTSVDLPDTLTSIGGAAFYGCTSLSSIHLPDSLTSIGSYAFYECTSLTSVDLPDTLTSIGGAAFRGCSSLSSVDFPETLASIGSAAFYECSSLSSIHLPDSLTSLGNCAFEECTSLTSVDLPDTLTSIGGAAFRGCSSLSSIDLPDSLTSIGNDAFNRCTSLSSIDLPANLTYIGGSAFSGCTSLSVVNAGQDITSVGYNAFSNCPGLTIYVWPGTVMEDYAIDNGLNYAYYSEFGSDGTLEVTLNAGLYEGMQLVLQLEDASMSRTISGESVYEFTGLDVGSKCTVQIINSFGDVILQTEAITIGKETTKTLEDSKNIGNLHAAVTDGQGNDKNTQVEIKWYDEAGRPIATGAELRGVLAGKVLICRVQLDAADSRVYRIPADIVHTVTSGDNLIAITLEKIPEITVTGRITSGGQPVTGASVTAAQKINTLYDRSITAVTDKDGTFALKIPAADAKITVHISGYAVEELALTELTADRDLGDIPLEAVSGAEVTLELQLIRTSGEPETFTALDDLDIRVRNVTRNAEIVDIWRRNMTLVLAEEASAGEQLELVISSLKGRFAPVSASVTLDNQRKATAAISLTEYGSLEAAFESTQNETIRLLVYREDGSAAESLSREATEKKLTTGLLPDGTYSVVLMGGSDFFVYPDTLEGLTLAGLEEGTDYVLQRAEVVSGQVAQASFESVPKLNESQFYYTDPSRTTVSSSKTVISAGRFFTLRAVTDFAAEYQGKMSDIQWVIQLPEGLEYYAGTLTVDKISAAYEQIDNRIFVPVEDPSRDLRLCLLATGSGKVSPAVYLQFVYDGKTIRQPVGTVTVQIDPFDFEVTGKTFDPSVTVFGTGVAGAEIQVFDNGVLVGQTKANASGSWKLTFDLYKPGTYSEHKLYAQINVVSGAKIRSATHTVIYQYSPEPVEVKTVAMYYNGRLTSVINFQTGEVQGSSYSPGSSATITFTVDFDCPDISRLSDVTLEVTQNNGQTRVLKAILDKETGLFAASDTFSMHAMPVNVAVSYVYDGELVFSEEHLTEEKERTAEFAAFLEDLSNEGISVFDIDLEPIVLDYESEVPYPETLIQAVEERNKLLEQYNKSRDYLYEVRKKLYGDVETQDKKVTLRGGILEASYEEGTEENIVLSEKIAEGYSVFCVGDGTNDFILIRTIINEETGDVQQHIIDTTSDGQGYVRFANSGPSVASASVKNVATVIPATPLPDGYSIPAQYVPLSMDLSDVKIAAGISYKTNANVSNLNSVAEYQNEIELHTNLLFEIVDGLGEMDSEVISETELYRDLVWDNFERRFYEYEELYKIDPAKAKEMEPTLEVENRQYDRLTDDIAEATKKSKVFDAIEEGGKFVGGAFDAFSIGNDINKISELNKIIHKTDDPQAKYARNLLYARIAVSGVGIVSIFVPGGNLVSGLTVAALTYAMEKMIDTEVEKVNQKFPGNGGKPLKVVIDPSGYIYEAVPSNRLSGATVTCYEKVTKLDIYDEPYEEIVLWNAADYDQVNPQLTDNLGQYAWDVPAGWWQVKAELEGYETTYSEWLPVPPPQLDVNLGMVSYAAPEISDIFAQTDSVEVTFSKYLRTETLTTDNISVNANGATISGTLELLNAEAEPGSTGKTLASKIRFVPSEELETGATVTVAISSDVLSYADVPAANGESADTTVIAIPDSLFVAENISLAYQSTGVIPIQVKPAHLAAGQTVQVSTASELMLKLETQTVTLDENGMALIRITGKLPGETELLFTMSDGRLQAGCTVRILMPETDENLTGVESLTIAQDYLALVCGHTASLLSEVRPKKLAEKVIWTVEKGGEKIIAVDSSGNVTALMPGTAYVLATVSDSEKALTARCRVDVAEHLVLDGVKLGTNEVTTELYSTDYTKLDILLLLPQNYAAMSESTDVSETLGAAISKACFTDEALQNLFTLNILDDRTLEIVPTSEAIGSKNIDKSYTGTITVNVGGTDYTTDNLTLTVKKTLPKLKVAVPAFNSFYSGQSHEIQVTGAAVTKVCAESLPQWLELRNGELRLTVDAPQKNASDKAVLDIWTEEWAVPVKATVSVKNTYRIPGLKLSASSVQLSDQPGSSMGVQLQLLPKSKKENLADFRIRGISAPEGYSIENYANGVFTLKAESGFEPGKIHLTVTFTDTKATVKLPVTVRTTQVKLKLAKSRVNLNAEIGDSAVVGITAAPADYILSTLSFRLIDESGNDKTESGELKIWPEAGTVRISTTETTPVNLSYELMIRAGDSEEVTLTVNTIEGEPSVRLKQSSNLDLSFDASAVITTDFKNYSGGKIEGFHYTVTETKSGVNATEFFSMEESNGTFCLICTNPGAVREKGAYVLNLQLTLGDGRHCDASLKLKIKRTAIKLKLSSGKVTLNKAVNDTTSVTVACTTKGYEFARPVWKLMDKSGQQSADGKLNINWVNGRLRIGTNANTEYGATYKLLICAAEGTTQIPLTITVPAEKKSEVTSTLKVDGKLDVIRNGSVTVTAKYKNCTAETARSETLKIVNSADEDVTRLFRITKNSDGSYAVSIAKNAEIDLTKKYQVQMTTMFGNTEVVSKAATLNIKMGSAKVTAETEGTLFADDTNSRVNLRFVTTDAALNEVARVEIKDARYADALNIFEYGNGEFAIGFREGKSFQSAMPITVTLNVYLDGNISNKPNASIKVKLRIVK